MVTLVLVYFLMRAIGLRFDIFVLWFCFVLLLLYHIVLNLEMKPTIGNIITKTFPVTYEKWNLKKAVFITVLDLIAFLFCPLTFLILAFSMEKDL
jgi:hypothetical protein